MAVADAATTAALRLAVLRTDATAGTSAPGDAGDAIHLAAFDGPVVVGAAALLARPFPLRPAVHNALQLRGMAVDPAHQGTGVGALVLARALDVARSRGDELLWCNARSTARGFYQRLGLGVEGEEFLSLQTGLPHFLMWRPVP
ncbi:MAG: GNAT family N-acetyltransferase [Jatrophihabitans sp.]